MKPIKEQQKEFAEFLSNYKGLVSKVSGIYCHHPEERKDLIQEIIIQLWKAFPKYDRKHSIATWTYRIAINVRSQRQIFTDYCYYICNENSRKHKKQ